MVEGSPCKLSIADVLKSCKDDLSENRILKLTTGHGKMKVLQIRHVWVQGKISAVHEKTGIMSFTLKDETASILVTDNGTAEASWISPGIYCSVVGKITQDGGYPGIEALKITNLSRNPVFEQMWPLEVKELKLFFLDLIKPKLVACRIDDD